VLLHVRSGGDELCSRLRRVLRRVSVGQQLNTVVLACCRTRDRAQAHGCRSEPR